VAAGAASTAGAWEEIGGGESASSGTIDADALPRAAMASVKEVVMKTTAAAAVTLAISPAGPRAPKTEDEDPPKAAPRPEPLPVCRRTLIMRITAAVTWMMVMLERKNEDVAMKGLP
jgi:hypothetical protein